MNITRFIYNIYFKRRGKSLKKYNTHAENIQRTVLRRLVNKAKDTQWGKEHSYSAVGSYEDFVKNVGVNTYEELKGYIQQMREGKKDILWPGTVRWYAKSSGTTNDKSKFIPVSYEGLKKIHYAGPRDCLYFYFNINPKSRLFSGKSLILGGSHAPNLNTPNSLVGDLSAILIENVPKAVNLTRVPEKEIALL